MRLVWVILVREYLEKVKTKGFWIATFALPAGMLLLMAISVGLSIASASSDRAFVLLDRTEVLGEQVAGRLTAAGYDMELLESDPGAAEMDRRVSEEEIEAYLVLGDRTLSAGAFAYRGLDRPSGARAALFEAVVADAALAHRLAEVGDPEGLRALVDGGRLEYAMVVDEADAAESGQAPETRQIARAASIAHGLAGAIFFYMTMAIYGAFVLRSVLEEKRTRIVEIVVASVRPWQLMLGKILGVGSMGLTQLSIWALCGLLIGAGGMSLVASMQPNLDLSMISAAFPTGGAMLLLVVYFVLGYFLYSSLFAAVGAMCTREEEAAHAQAPLIVLLMVPFIAQISTVGGGGFVWMDWVALFPFFSPIMMFPRAVDGSVSGWMVAASLALMALAVWAMAWLGGRIYRVGILAQGKRPTIRELYRWVRAG